MGWIPLPPAVVESIDDLSDVDTSTDPPITGDVLKWDGSNWVPAEDLAESGGGSGFTYSGAGVKRTTSAQTITANTETAIQFNGEDWDTDSYHDNSTNNTRLTIPSTDKYLLTGAVTCNNLDGGTNVFFIRLAVDGTATDHWLYRADNMSEATKYVSFSQVLDLTSGQYVEVNVFQGTGSFDIAADRTRVQISRLG